MIRALVEGVRGYGGLFWVCALSGIVLPLPEDVSLLYAGIRLRDGGFAWAPTLAVTLCGVMTRDLVAYGVGRLLGEWLLERVVIRRLMGEGRIRRARELVAVRGSRAVFVGRFLVGARAPVFMVSGAMGVPLRSFLIWNSAGLVIAVPAMIALGHRFGQPMVEGLVSFVLHSRWVIVGFGCLVFGWIAWRLRHGDAMSGDDEVSEPER